MRLNAVTSLALGCLVAECARAAPLPKPALILDRYERRVDCVAVSPDSRTLAAGGDDGRVLLWSLAKGKEPFAFDERPRIVDEVFFVEGGKTLLVSSCRRPMGEAFHPTTLSWYDLKSRRKVRTLSFEAGLGEMLLSPDGKVLVTASGDRKDPSLKLREPATGKVLGEVSHPAYRARAFTPDSKRLLIGCPRYKVVAYDLATRKESVVADLGWEMGGISGLAVSPDGGTLALAASTGGAVFVDLSTGKERARWDEEPLTDCGRCLHFVRKGSWLLVDCWRGGAVGVLDPRTGKRLCRYLPVLWGFRRFVVSPDEKWLLTVPGDDDGVWIWRLRDLEDIRVVEEPNHNKR